jgi:hypothetical protein
MQERRITFFVRYRIYARYSPESDRHIDQKDIPSCASTMTVFMSSAIRKTLRRLGVVAFGISFEAGTAE